MRRFVVSVLLIGLGIGGLSYAGILPWREILRSIPQMEFDPGGAADRAIERWSPKQ